MKNIFGNVRFDAFAAFDSFDALDATTIWWFRDFGNVFFRNVSVDAFYALGASDARGSLIVRVLRLLFVAVMLAMLVLFLFACCVPFMVKR